MPGIFDDDVASDPTRNGATGQARQSAYQPLYAIDLQKGADELSKEEREQYLANQRRALYSCTIGENENGQFVASPGPSTHPAMQAGMVEANHYGGVDEDSVRRMYSAVMQDILPQLGSLSEADCRKACRERTSVYGLAQHLYPDLSPEDAALKEENLFMEVFKLGYGCWHPEGGAKFLTERSKALLEQGQALDELIGEDDIIESVSEYAAEKWPIDAKGDLLPESIQTFKERFKGQDRLRFLAENPVLAAAIDELPAGTDLFDKGNEELVERILLGTGSRNRNTRSQENNGFIRWYLLSPNSSHSARLASQTDNLRLFIERLAFEAVRAERSKTGKEDFAKEMAIINDVYNPKRLGEYSAQMVDAKWLAEEAMRQFNEKSTQTAASERSRRDALAFNIQRLRELKEEGEANKEERELWEKEEKKRLEEDEKLLAPYREPMKLYCADCRDKNACAAVHISSRDYLNIIRSRNIDPKDVVAVKCVFAGSNPAYGPAPEIPVFAEQAITNDLDEDPQRPRVYMNAACSHMLYAGDKKYNVKRETGIQHSMYFKVITK